MVIVNRPQQRPIDMGHFNIGDIVIYNGNRYVVVQYLGNIMEFVEGFNDPILYFKYNIQPVDGGDLIEVRDGDIVKEYNNNNNNNVMILDNNAMNQDGGRRSLRSRRRSRSYRKKAKKSLRSKHNKRSMRRGTRRGSRRH